MKTKFIVLAPYELNILTAIIDGILLNLASFIIIGDKKKIMFLCLKYNININLLKIIDVTGDINICLKAEELLSKNFAKYIIKGSIRQEVVDAIFKKSQTDCLANLYLVNLSNSKWLFGLCYLNNNDFESQALAIYESMIFLSKLGINTKAIGILDDETNYESKKNTELIKMYLNHKLNINCKIYNYYRISDIINLDKPGLNNEQIRINFVKNKSHLDIINLLKSEFNFKTTLITIMNRYMMLSVEDELSDNILFSIFLLDKMNETNIMSKKN